MSLIFGINAENAVEDVTGSPVPITLNGATTTAAQFKFGAKSINAATAIGYTWTTVAGNVALGKLYNAVSPYTGKSLTVECWFLSTTNAASRQAEPFVEFNDKTTGRSLFFYNESSAPAGFRRVHASWQGDDVSGVPIDLANGVWHHIALVFSDSFNLLRFYADGNYVGERAGLGANGRFLPATTTDMFIGGGATGCYIDNISVWDEARYTGTGTYTMPGEFPAIPDGTATAAMSLPKITSASTGSGPVNHAVATVTLPPVWALSYNQDFQTSIFLPVVRSYASGKESFDPYFDNVILLIKGDAPNFAPPLGPPFGQYNYIWDWSSFGNHEPPWMGIVTIGFGGKFDSEHVRISASGLLNLVTSEMLGAADEDFTVEFWALTTANYPDRARITNSDRFSVYLNGGYAGHEYSLTFNCGGQSVTTGNNVVDFGFSAIAIVKSGLSMYLYAKGIKVATITLLNHTPLTSTPVFIHGPTGDVGAHAYDEIRVTKGVARYTGDSYPPQTTGFPTHGPLNEVIAYIPGITVEISGSTTPEPVMILPAVTASATGYQPIGNAELRLPAVVSYSIGHNATGEQSATISLPCLTAIANAGGGCAVSTPSLSSSIAGTVTNMSQAAVTIPIPDVLSSGTVSAMAESDITFPALTAACYSGALCSVVIGGVAAQVVGTTGAIGMAQMTLPLLEATVIATVQNYGSAHIPLPSLAVGATVWAQVNLPGMKLTAIGFAVITATYEAYAVNIGHRPRVTNQEIPVNEVTRYTNFPFTHVVRYKNSYYGVNDTGLYLLEGTTDAATPIPFAVKTAMTDFKTPTKKTLASAYFSGRFGPASTIKLHAGEQTPNSYSFSTPRDALAQNHRQVFGKGIKERYHALEVSGTGVCELDSIELEVHNLSRRI